ncbi:hypothetical protein JTB14_028535 [Gonioctena quinquepunctata]|nr:hypothetical protein JTB14_028535 [Gonioctena quinquepunctata]
MSMELLTIVYLLSAIVVAIFLYSKWIYSYWKRLGLDYLEPEFPYGNYKYFFKRNLSFGDQLVNIYKELKSRGLQHGGCFQFLTPVYVPIDLEVVKCILQKDFAHFMNHGLYINERDDPLTGHLFNLEDEKWKRLRIKLTPTFTSGKMKMMFQCLVSCAEGLGDILKENSIIQEAVDIKEVLSCFTTDVIGSVAFGIDCNSLKNPDSEFRQWGRKIFTSDFYRRIKRMIGMTIPRDILIKLGFKRLAEISKNFS